MMTITDSRRAAIRGARVLASFAATCSAVSLASADVTLPSIISDHMVLQRDARATIWGWANPGDQIVVTPSWAGSTPQTAIAAPREGLWTVQLKTPASGGPCTLQIKGPDNAITVSDILLGEVWVCGGQSNMEMTIDNIGPGEPGVDSAATILAGANAPQLRYFDVPNVLSAVPTEHCNGKWVVCSPGTAGPFSAVGYFFARSLQNTLDVPVGLVSSNWGGTRVEAWTSKEVLRSLNVCGEELDMIEKFEADPGLPERLARQREAKWWDHLREVDPGSAAKPDWSSETLDDSKWDTATLPGIWDASPADAFDGVVWYRRVFNAPIDFEDHPATLHLGAIDDMDTTWINGRLVGAKETAGTWFIPREYEVPKGVLRAGTNTIVVRVLDTGGAGGFTGNEKDLSLTIGQQTGAATDMGQTVSLAGQWRMKRGATMQQLGSWPWSGELHANSPSVLYNGMIVPIRRFAVRGAIWYQGESNRNNAYDYRRLFPAMIENWRQSWGVGAAEFPFYFVQIAPFGYWGEKGETPVVRESQHVTMQTAPNTGMIVTMDVGNKADIHPRNKKAVGERLALWALTKTYGKDAGEYSGPLYKSMRIVDGRVELSLTHADGLQWRGSEPIGFQIAGSDRNFVPAQARIEGNHVIVWSAEVSKPAAVRYGWGDAIEPNLFNKADLPAAPFRTDDWPVETQPR